MPVATAAVRSDRWEVRGTAISLERPRILGILNVTPDSFSDGGRFLDPARAVEHGEALRDAGADLIDVGGESTRPGAEPVDAATEWRRIGPVVAGLAARRIPVSVDTTKSDVARRALEAGAVALNDVSGLRRDAGLAEAAAEHGAGLVLMHMRGDPRTMQRDVEYDDLCGEVRAFLESAVRTAERRGCRPAQVVVDPGLGFGKSAAGSLELLARLPRAVPEGRPILVGPSRKSFIGAVLELGTDERLEGTLAACIAALERGARLFRVHDVRAVRRALDMAEAIRRAGRD